MKLKIRRHPDVAEDIVGIASYIAQNSVTTAFRFVDSVEATLEWILEHRGAGRLRDFEDPRLSRVRSWAVKRFRNHLIFYEIEQSGIFVLAIVHGARDLPRVIQERVE